MPCMRVCGQLSFCRFNIFTSTAHTLQWPLYACVDALFIFIPFNPLKLLLHNATLSSMCVCLCMHSSMCCWCCCCILELVIIIILRQSIHINKRQNTQRKMEESANKRHNIKRKRKFNSNNNWTTKSEANIWLTNLAIKYAQIFVRSNQNYLVRRNQ